MLCFSLQQHMSIGKIQTLTLLTHQVSLSTIYMYNLTWRCEFLMSPSSKVQMRGGSPGRGGGGGGKGDTEAWT